MDSAQNNTGFYQHNPFPDPFPHSNRSTQTWVPPRRTNNNFFLVEPEVDVPSGLRKRPMPWDAIYPPPKPLVELVTFAPGLIHSLWANPDEMMLLSPDRFEELIAELFVKMGCDVKRTGKVYAPDGGVDIIAISKSSGIPFHAAIQVKHHRTNRPTAIGAVRELVYLRNYFGLGYLVTNTHFTGPAKQFAMDDVNRCFLRLRDRDAVQGLLGGNCIEDYLRDLPTFLTLPGGKRIDFPIPEFLKK